MNKLKIGDVVKLASGGPAMSVISDDTTIGTVFCQWFGPDGAVKEQAFPEDALVKTPDSVGQDGSDRP